MRKRVIGAMAAAGIGVAGLLATPGVAQAHSVYQGSDYANHSYDGTAFAICDAENDGHSVWAGYYDDSSNSYKTGKVHYTSDTSGVDCTIYYLSHHLTNIRVVENKPGSSNNYYGAWHGYPVVHN